MPRGGTSQNLRIQPWSTNYWPAIAIKIDILWLWVGRFALYLVIIAKKSGCTNQTSALCAVRVCNCLFVCMKMLVYCCIHFFQHGASNAGPFCLTKFLFKEERTRWPGACNKECCKSESVGFSPGPPEQCWQGLFVGCGGCVSFPCQPEIGWQNFENNSRYLDLQYGWKGWMDCPVKLSTAQWDDNRSVFRVWDCDQCPWGEE